MNECNNLKQSPIAGLAGYGGGAGSVLFGRKGVDGYTINRSLRFNSGDQTYLNRTPSTSGNRRTFTLAFWIKRSKLVNCGSSGQEIFRAGDSAYSAMNFAPSDGPCDALSFKADQSGVGPGSATNAVFRDFSAWFHVVYRIDTTQSTASNRVRVYVNGVEQTWHTTNYPSQNQELKVNQSGQPHYVGGTEYFDGYLADIHFIDGQSLGPSSFGETNDDGIWDPKEFDGSFGTNGFHLKFDDPTDLGNDESGNNNDFTPNGFVGVLGADVPVANATGALPIRNTTGTYGGTVASGNRTDSQSGLQLAMPLRADLTDTSGNSYTITNTGVAFQSNHSKFYGQSAAFFDTDKVGISNASGLGAFGTGDFTVEVYVKFTDNGHYYGRIIEFGSVNNNAFVVDGTQAPFRLRYDGNNNSVYGTAGTIPLNKWTHVAAVRNSGTLKFYVDGIEGGSHNFTHNLAGGSAQLGNYLGSQLDFDGYMQDLRVYSSAKYTSNFTPPNNPTNKLPSEELDSLFDSPTNGSQSDTGAGGEINGNYCTWNLSNTASNLGLANGNLDTTSFSGSSTAFSYGTIGVSSGKWYYEATPTSIGASPYYIVGWGRGDKLTSNGSDEYLYYSIGALRGASSSNYGASWTSGDVVGVALDLDAGTLVFYKNGVSQGTAFTGITGTVFPKMGYWHGNGAFNFGQRAFAYNAPSGYKTLCTTNLPDPTIADGSKEFDAVLWTANNGSAMTVSGLSFSPDLVWGKGRSYTGSHAWYDTVRGATKYLSSNTTGGEGTIQGVTAFTSDGFTLGSDSETNYQSNTLVGWCWNAGANSNKTYTVKVVSDSGNKYRFDDFGTSAVTLDLEEGSTYVFDQSDSSNSGHPLRFSTTSDGTHNSGTEYTTGVTTTGTPGSAGAKTTIVVGSGVATLYYYCSSHSGMGGQANTNSTAGASVFDGSIQSTVKANPAAGFSVVTWTGIAGNATIGHGLNAAPELIFLKFRGSTSNWSVYHSAIGNTKRLLLNSNGSTSTSSTYWQNTSPTSSVFSVGGDLNDSTTIVAYCFAPVVGYSAFGSYIGNSASGYPNADGPFVFTGMRPAFVMIKSADASENWVIYDTARSTFNYTDDQLYPNANTAEASGLNREIDVYSNGFKIRSNGGFLNTNNDVYIWAAFAEHPLKTARAR